jgi:pentatricopeptide repeat domain-containing protein 1
VYKDMVWKGLERSVITYSSLISACEKAGRWEAALQLFDEMTRDGCTPNTVTYNSLITACGQGAARRRAPGAPPALCCSSGPNLSAPCG